MDASAIPIDIHYNKLLDWLLNRRHCGPQWQSTCLSVREKINTAIQDMPEHSEIRDLLAGTFINYFHCLRIVEILRDTEAASKNIFGRYSSQRMKDWQQVVRDYEKDDIYLGEAAQLLMRSVNYDIPALKRQMKQCQQEQTDCVRKEKEYASNSAELKNKYAIQCKNMHIEGKHIKRELMSLVRDMPSTYEDIAEKVKLLKSSTQYYEDFIRFTLNNAQTAEESVPMLKYMLKNGNTTCMQYRTGVVPSRIEPPICDYGEEDDEEKSQEASDEIDFGDGEIDFGISLTSDSGQTAEIDFGDINGDDGIDYGIDFGDVDAVEIQVIEGSGEDVVSSLSEEGVARGNDALTLLDNVATRNEFINQLIELQCFFTTRLQEMRSSSAVSATQLESAPASLHVDKVEVEKMVAHLDDIYSRLTNTRIQELMLIRSSPRYVDRLTEKVKSLQSESEKQMSRSRLMITQREEARQRETDLHPQLDLIRKKMKELKSQIEVEISKKYKNRRVNIMGEINTV